MKAPKDKKTLPAGATPTAKPSQPKDKLIRLDDLIPKGNVSGGRQLLFGATEIKQTNNKTRKQK